MFKRNESNWIQTYCGVKFFPTDPLPQDVHIEDIAHALSLSCRYTGHVREFYSVAEHCVHVFRLCSEENKAWGLLHDASEAYISDIARPVKPLLANYQELEENLMKCIAARFELPWPAPKEVKQYDTAMLLIEKEDLLGPSPQEWDIALDISLPVIYIECWGPKEAERRFLEAYDSIYNK